MQRNFVFRGLAWLGGTLAIFGLGFVLAHTFGPTAPVQADSPTVTDFPAGTAAMRVAIDPETGALVAASNPAKAQDADLQNMLSRSSAGLVEVTHPDGSVSVNLQGRFMSASVARIGADGNVETTCVENADAATEFLGGSEPAHAPEVK